MITDKLKRLLNDDVGAITILAAILLPFFIGFIGMAINLGLLRPANAQLKNSVGAVSFTVPGHLISDNGGGLVVVNYFDSAAAFEVLTEANELCIETGMFKTMPWDFDIGSFVYTDFSNELNDLTAARITLTRTNDLTGLFAVPRITHLSY